MPIPTEQARAVLDEFRSLRFANLFAQAHAKHVLLEVGEQPTNFPDFAVDLDDRVTFAAYSILAAGCSLLEEGAKAEGAKALEQSAALLHFVHGPNVRTSRESAFHSFVAGLAFYAAGQYSRAFVAVRAIEDTTPAARVVATFLRKDLPHLVRVLNDVLLRSEDQLTEQADLDERVITVCIARALATALEFTLTGEPSALAAADGHLDPALRVAQIGEHAGWWWVVRLVRLTLSDLREASPWRVLPAYFSAGSPELDRYVRLLAQAKRPPVLELWRSQRDALPLALDPTNRGAVINLRTSAGKTRVAELAILQALQRQSMARVLYLAPFRSLALEVEQTLSATFSVLGHNVSHLYGGSRVSSVDTELAADAAILIATPEKTRALLRAAPELFANVRLVIADEGHLIGADTRHIRNELFLDHLRALVGASGARLLLLSAVLPNARDLATWITGSANQVASSPWKPSAERFGLLRWNGSRVRIDWRGDFPSFNPSFVEARSLGFGRRRKHFPATKGEAIAATAVRLTQVGPVMVFTARARSVPSLAKSVLLALGEHPTAHAWPQHEWRVFEAVCREELASDAIELRAAHAGVICHSNRLTPQVRLAMEHLMRSAPPRVVVATTTLSQGVNIGISSVIVATPYMSAQRIDKRTFWNICGRAGRAFIDSEGKILYAIDETRPRESIRRDERLAATYFDGATGDPVRSGLLAAIHSLARVAARANVTFELLLELCAENDFARLGSSAPTCEDICDLLDDELLALHSDPLTNPGDRPPVEWVETVFRGSLAVVQAAASGSGVAADGVLALLTARATSALRRVAPNARKGVVSSGLPLRVALRVRERLDAFRSIADALSADDGESLDVLTDAVKRLERWALQNAPTLVEPEPDRVLLNTIRRAWLSGIALRTLGPANQTTSIAKDFYGYQLPWVIHAASQQLRGDDESDRGDALARAALLVELGLPTQLAARIFLAGVRSRAAATELAGVDMEFGGSVAEVSHQLRNHEIAEQLRQGVSADTADWLDLLRSDAPWVRGLKPPTFRQFVVADAGGETVLHARTLGNDVFLCSTDARVRIPVESSAELPFAAVADDVRLAFTKNSESDHWQLTLRDPRLEPDTA